MGLGVAILALGLKYGPEGWDLNHVAGFGPAMTMRCILDRLRFRVRCYMSDYDYAYDSTYL